MSWRNILLGYSPIREALQKAEKLDQGSPYERKAINYFLIKNMREAYGLYFSDTTDELMTLCKAEAVKAIPALDKQELDDFANSRNNHINNLTLEIVKGTKEATNAFVESIQKATLESFNLRLNEQFSDAKLDGMVADALSKLDSSIAAELTKSVIERIGGKSD